MPDRSRPGNWAPISSGNVSMSCLFRLVPKNSIRRIFRTSLSLLPVSPAHQLATGRLGGGRRGGSRALLPAGRAWAAGKGLLPRAFPVDGGPAASRHPAIIQADGNRAALEVFAPDLVTHGYLRPADIVLIGKQEVVAG